MTVDEALRSAADRLARAEVLEPRREAASLLVHVLQRSNSFLIAHPEYELSIDEAANFESVVERRERREPFQYITGRQEFWGLEFDVAPGVLIPRPETEILVEAAIDFLRPFEHPTFAEAGIGSGCISVSILHSVPAAHAVATDISDAALSIARSNAEKLAVSERLSLQKTDLFAGITRAFDLIVSNPPYIPDADAVGLQPEVRDFEPHTALFGGGDGLEIVRRIVADARHILRRGGVLMMEIGAGQAASVVQMFDAETWETPAVLPDLQSIPRVVAAGRR